MDNKDGGKEGRAGKREEKLNDGMCQLPPEHTGPSADGL